MTADRCPECAQALLGPWRSYRNTCPECQIRCIANTDQHARATIYERIEAECGHQAMVAIKEKVGLEIVRVRLLKEGHKS